MIKPKPEGNGTLTLFRPLLAVVCVLFVCVFVGGQEGGHSSLSHFFLEDGVDVGLDVTDISGLVTRISVSQVFISYHVRFLNLR